MINNYIKHGFIDTAFQPIFNIENGDIFGYEALSRFSYCSPGHLFKWAQKCGLDGLLDLSCLKYSIKKALQVISADKYLFININPNTIKNYYKKGTKMPGKLKINTVVEITEADEFNDYELLKDFADWLRSMQIKIAVDDIASGYDRLANIAYLNPEFIKIDRPLLNNGHSSAIILKNINNMAQELGSTVICEGIETNQELELIQDTGIYLVQGNYLGVPTSKSFSLI